MHDFCGCCHYKLKNLHCCYCWWNPPLFVGDKTYQLGDMILVVVCYSTLKNLYFCWCCSSCCCRQFIIWFGDKIWQLDFCGCCHFTLKNLHCSYCSSCWCCWNLSFIAFLLAGVVDKTCKIECMIFVDVVDISWKIFIVVIVLLDGVVEIHHLRCW